MSGASQLPMSALLALQVVRNRRLSAGVALIEERLALLEAEGEAALSWDTLECGSRHCLAMGDAVASKKFGARAAECARLALGTQCDEFESYLKLSGGNEAGGAAEAEAAEGKKKAGGKKKGRR